MKTLMLIGAAAAGLAGCASTPDAVYVDLAPDGSCTAVVHYIGQADMIARECAILVDVPREPLAPRVRLDSDG